VLYLRRLGRRIKGHFWSIVYFFQGIWKRLQYERHMRALSLSEKYIREAFSYLACLDIGEFVVVQGFPNLLPTERVEMKCWGNEVHIKHIVNMGPKGEIPTPVYEFILKESWGGKLYCHEWRKEEREVRMEFGACFKTHWFEIYRSGKFIDPPATVRMNWYLRKIYGDGPNKENRNAVQEP
jgi:hypothetical protein